jgi:CheY-like chemotaxis protein
MTQISKKGRNRMKKPQVLVVDDEKIIHTTMRKALKSSNLALSFATNGKEALKIMKKTPPSLIFLDLSMPVMDGFTFLDRIIFSAQTAEHGRSQLSGEPLD